MIIQFGILSAICEAREKKIFEVIDNTNSIM